MTVIAGRYRLLDVLAEGATGTVWRALDETDRREVALKEFRAPVGLPADEVPLLYARREREARAAARISHPSVVRVLGVATEDGRPWVVTELVRGLTLAETLDADGPLPAREAARVGAEVLAGLRAAREAGVPHRGVGPKQVLLANDGRVVVTGFGGAPDGPTDPGADLRSLGALLEAAADDRSGPLGAVIDGLTGEEPVMTADQVERELRRVAAGGAPRTEAAPVEASAPPRTGPGDEGGTGTRAGTAPAPSRRAGPQRTAPRRGPVLVAGIVGALLLAGALVYQAVRDDGPGTGPGPGGVTSTAPSAPGTTGTDGGPATAPR
ncbi:protein kinase [Streptomyces sp. NK15101]|uniref:protein kinase domain-containing protein n=1 Tax=Streptomyces sp. NK15101 TaxID=2873261 RepID=UPI001CEDE8BF|nr:protein kinase [Streptomyces sp. NK15101]